MNLAGNTVLGAKPGRSLVPLLVILFLVSYGLLTTLVVEQGNTIDSQSRLMHLLLKDSFHLSALKAELRKNQSAHASNVQAAPNSQVQAPLSQKSFSQKSLEKIPVIQVPSVEAGSSRPKAQAGARKFGKAVKPPSSVRPPAELTDPSDMRRVTFSI